MFDVGEVWFSVYYWQVKRGRPEVLSHHRWNSILGPFMSHSPPPPTPPCIRPPSTFFFLQPPLPPRQRYISWKLEKPGTSNLRSVLIKLGYKIQAQFPYLSDTFYFPTGFLIYTIKAPDITTSLDLIQFMPLAYQSVLIRLTLKQSSPPGLLRTPLPSHVSNFKHSKMYHGAFYLAAWVLSLLFLFLTFLLDHLDNEHMNCGWRVYYAKSGIKSLGNLKKCRGGPSQVEPLWDISHGSQEVPLCNVSLGHCAVMWGQSMESVTSAMHRAPFLRQRQEPMSRTVSCLDTL